MVIIPERQDDVIRLKNVNELATDVHKHGRDTQISHCQNKRNIHGQEVSGRFL